MSLAQLKLSQKLPIFITAIAILSCVATGLVTVSNATKVAHHEAEEKILALQETRTISLETYLHSIEEDLSSMAYSDYVSQALLDFDEGYKDIATEGNPVKILKDLYITNNKFPTGEKENLDYAKDGSLYSQVHQRYHPWFRHFLRQRDYYDIFLFNTKGDLVYTVFKELDYATNLNTGKYKDTDLGNAFRAAKKSHDKDSQSFFDFKPYAPSHGAAASFISQPIIRNGKLLGVLVFQMPITRINTIMNGTAGLGETGETYIVGADHYMRNDSRFLEEGEETTILTKEIKEETVDLALQGKHGVKVVNDHIGHSVLSAYGLFEFRGTKWVVLADIYESEVQEPIKKMKISALLTTLTIATIIGFLSLLLSKTITGPITAMTHAMEELANDNLTADIPGTARKDEIGTMAAAVQVFKENGIETKKLQEQQAKNEERAEAEKQRMLTELADKFDAQVGGTIDELAEAAIKLQEASKDMEVTATKTQEASTSVSAAAEQTSANVTTVSSATEEMAASAREISTQVVDVATKANLASTSATTTSQEVDALNDLVENIGEVVISIKDIAEQTNLLALNATIEAARAGEAGKGFAVVADEVKKLASETSQKTEEIETRITQIQKATQASVESMQMIISSISEINESSSGTSAAAEEQNSVISEITRNITEVSDAAKQVANVIGTVQVASSETGESAQVLNGYANDISNLSQDLKKSVEEFLMQLG